MKRQSIYLPSLNSLFLQNQHFQKHRRNVDNSRSVYDSYRSDINVGVGEVGKQVVLLRNANDGSSQFRNIKQVKLSRYASCESSREGVSPFEKRKLSDRDMENGRLYQVLHKCRSLYGRDREGERVYDALKERIRKYRDDGRAVKYKFKKSLTEIERRKQLRVRQESYRSMSVDQARDILSIVRRNKSIKRQTKSNNSNKGNDIYVQTIRSRGQLDRLLLKTQPSKEIIKGEGYESIAVVRQKAKSILSDNLVADSSHGDVLGNKLKNNRYMWQCVQNLRVKKREKLMGEQAAKMKMIVPSWKSGEMNDLQIVVVSPVVVKLSRVNKTENV